MAKILFAYEFGAGLGHLNRLLAVASRLREHDLTFALPDLALGRPAVERKLGPGSKLRQGVVWPAPADPRIRQVPTDTLADVLRLFGFHQIGLMQARVRAWQDLLEELQPDLIVSDFAPTLRLASGGRIPAVVVGNGYTAPPRGRPLPPIRPWQASVPARSRQHEGELLATVNAVRDKAGGDAIDHFADLFHGDSSFICTLDEFDPYRSLRETAALWPFNVPVIPNGADRERDRIFAYFQAGHPALEAVLQALSRLGRRAEIYVQGADPRSIAARCPRHVGVHTKPADFAAILPRASLLIHHAGLGTAYSGLVAGVPQVVVPLNLEHAITTSGLEAFGTARRCAVRPLPLPKQFAQICADVLDAGPEREAAMVAQRNLAARRDPVSLERVVGACNALL